MHRDRSLGFLGAVLAGVVAHLGLAGLEAVFPGIAAHRLDPFLRLLPAALAAFLATGGPRRSAPVSSPGAWLAAGLTSLIGISLSLGLGQPGPQVLPPLVGATGDGVMTGLVVGGLSWVWARRRQEGPEVRPEHPAGSYPEAPRTR